MNREIKFRAWDKVRNRFVYPTNIAIVGDGEVMEYEGSGEWSSTDRFIVSQFTGLKDKNGKEIYEGDLVSYQKHDGYLLDSFVGEMRWIAPGYMVKCPAKYVDISRIDELQNDFLNHLDVIGNIYENPELLAPAKNKKEINPILPCGRKQCGCPADKPCVADFPENKNEEASMDK